VSKTVTVTSRLKGVPGFNVQVTDGSFTTTRSVVNLDGKWFAVNPFVLSGATLEFPDADSAITAVSNLEI
jgi:hypothetical protein